MTDHDPDYCARCQEEAFIQRLGKELFDWLDSMVELDPKFGTAINDDFWELVEKEAQDVHARTTT